MSHVETQSGGTNSLTKYVAKVADLMELRDWRVIVSDAPCEEEYAGSMDVAYGRKVACLALSEGFGTDRPADRRHVVVHELLHCHLDQMNSAVERDLEGALSHEGHRVFGLGYRRAMEYATDGIATIIARHMPLPPEG